MAPHKEDWTGIGYRRDPHCGRGGSSRSRSSSPEPSEPHLKVLPAPYWGKEKYYVYMLGVAHYITEEQVQEINKMKLKQDEEMKKLLREVDDDYVLQSDEEWVTEEDIKKMEEDFADALDDFIKEVIGCYI